MDRYISVPKSPTPLTVREIIKNAHAKYHKAREDKGVYAGKNEEILKKSEWSVNDHNRTDEELLNDLRAIIAVDKASYPIFNKALNDSLILLAESSAESLIQAVNDDLLFHQATLDRFEDLPIAKQASIAQIATQECDERLRQIETLRNTLTQYITQDNRDKLGAIELKVVEMRSNFIVTPAVLDKFYTSTTNEVTGGYDTLKNYQEKRTLLEERIKIYESLVARYFPTNEEENAVKQTHLTRIAEFKELEETLRDAVKNMENEVTLLHTSCTDLVDAMRETSRKISEVQTKNSSPVMGVENKFLPQLLQFSQTKWFNTTSEVKPTQEYLDGIVAELQGKNFTDFLNVVINAVAAYQDIQATAQDPASKKLMTSVDYTTIMPLALQTMVKLPVLLKEIITHGEQLDLNVDAMKKVSEDIETKIKDVNDQSKKVLGVTLPNYPEAQRHFNKVSYHLARIAIYQRSVERELNNNNPVAANQQLNKLENEIRLSIESVSHTKKAISIDKSLTSEKHAELTGKATAMHSNLVTLFLNGQVPTFNDRLKKSLSSSVVPSTEAYQALLTLHCSIQVSLRSLRQPQATVEMKKKALEEMEGLNKQFETLAKLLPAQNRHVEKCRSENESRLEEARKSTESKSSQFSEKRSVVHMIAKGFSAIFSSATGSSQKATASQSETPVKQETEIPKSTALKNQ